MVKIDREKVFWRKVDGQTLLLNMDTGFYYALDEIAGLIWNLAARGSPLEAIATGLMNQYDVDRGTAQKDIRFLLGQLKKEGLAS